MKFPDLKINNGDHYALLIRHAERGNVIPNEASHTINLTINGKHDAFNMGMEMKETLGDIYTSPIIRCVQTASWIVYGSGTNHRIKISKKLGDPGAWIEDDQIAFKSFIDLGIHKLIKRLLSGENVPGMKDFKLGFSDLLNFISKELKTHNGKVPVFISHDAVIAPVVGFALKTTNPDIIFPTFLEGTIILRNSSGYKLYWRGKWYPLHYPD